MSASRPMKHTSYLAALARDGEEFADSCAAAGLSSPVASCPGWSVADLAWHLTEVHYFWRSIVSERRDTPQGVERLLRPSDTDLLTGYRSGLVETLAVLTAVDWAQPNWTWSADHTAGFVVRRMAQETAVHRWDADLAATRRNPIEAKLASDGVDEFLTHMIGDVIADAAPIQGSVHLHCTDVPGEWTLRPTDGGGHSVTREHSKGDAAMRGTASDLLLVLWRRLELERIEVVGDAQVAKRFVAQTSLD